jgi:predicted protein tyrosine phosphatase
MFSLYAPPSERIYAGALVSFLVLSRFDVATATPSMPYVVISITDPERPEAVIAESPNRRAVLRMCFHDKSGARPAVARKVPMTREDAQAIISFVRAHLAGVQLIVCQCEAGISRSAAVAAALSRILQGEDHFFFEHYAPNDWVYHTLLGATDEGKINNAA